MHFLLRKNINSDDFRILKRLAALSSHVNAAKTLCNEWIGDSEWHTTRTHRSDVHMDTEPPVNLHAYVRARPDDSRHSPALGLAG